jgi:hypothetical protein
MLLDSSGNLFVGGTNGNARLTVRGSGTTSATASIEGATSSGATRFLVSDDGLCRWYGTSNAETMRLDSSGNLGIGTSSPGGRLDVITGSARWRITNDGSGNVIEENLDTAGTAYRDKKLYGLNLISYTSGAERMRLDSSGNLGIGTSSPTRKLFVNGFSNLGGSTNSVLIGDGTFAAGVASITADSGAALQIGTAGNNELSLFHNNTTIVRLIGGNFGMRTDSFGTSSVGVIGIGNAVTVPTGNPTGGGVLYVEAGALKYRGSSGTVTTIANA